MDPQDEPAPARGRGIYLLPNLLTTGGLFGGFFAIIAASQERFEIAFDADPPISATFHGLHPEEVGEEVNVGLIAPAMHCVNAIPYVVPAAPGFVTYLDLPLIAGRGTQGSK